MISTPKRDLLASQMRDHFTKALDETYERGFLLGRAAGCEYALKLLRDNKVQNVGDIIDALTKAKYPS